MKKINPLLLLMVMAVVLLPAQDQGSKKKKAPKTKITYTSSRAVAYLQETLLISDADLNCAYFIKKKQSSDLFITGPEDVELEKEDFSDTDRMIINKGSNHGINEGDIFLVLGKGQRIHSRITSKNLGTYYLKKSLAEVSYSNEDSAVVTLKKSCHSVHIGDILIPYKPQETVFEKKVDYRRSRLPESGIEGNVVYLNADDVSLDRDISGSFDYVTVDLGKAMVARGDWLLFYKKTKGDLPPIIIGSGIVVDSQNTNSTVKIIDAGGPIEVGIKLVLLPPEAMGKTEEGGITDEFEEITADQLGREDVPLIGPSKALVMDVLFELNDTSIRKFYKKNLAKIKAYIDSKSAFTITLRGYSCSIGRLEYNLTLAKKRVESVKKYLMETYNIKTEFFQTHFYGEKDCLYDNTTEEQRRRNRRVRVEVMGK